MRSLRDTLQSGLQDRAQQAVRIRYLWLRDFFKGALHEYKIHVELARFRVAAILVCRWCWTIVNLHTVNLHDLDGAHAAYLDLELAPPEEQAVLL